MTAIHCEFNSMSKRRSDLQRVKGKSIGLGRKRGLLALAIWLMLVSASLGASDQQEPMSGQSPDLASVKTTSPDARYVIGKGDVLFISVWRDDALTNSVVVLPDGTIAFPLVGELPAAGKTVGTLKTELAAKIDHFIPDPTLSVMVQQVNSMQFYIIGKVNRPGSYPLNTDLNVLQALSIAGGLNSFADRKQIKVFRKHGGETQIFPFDYKRVAQGKSLDQNINLERGDIIVVP